MKNQLTRKGLNFRQNAIASLIVFLISSAGFNVYSQQLPECDATVPLLIVDLSSNPDSTYISPSIQRVDQCCGAANNVNFVSFYATLHPNAAMVEIGIYDGANPSGSGEYHFVDGGDLIIPGTCVPPTPAGQPVCIPPSIPGPNYKIGYGKPGNNMNQFFFRQILKPTFPEDDSTRIGCTLPINVYGLDNITTTAINSSVGPLDIPLYNSYLSCLNCSDPIFEPGAGAPAWIDYVISGTQQASGACGVYQTQDTVRLYTFSALSATYAPNPAEICAGGSVNITASASGGSNNYSYVWTNSIQDTLSLIDNHTFNLEGSYTAIVSDELVTPSCPAYSLPVSIIVSQPPTVNAGPDQKICATSPEAFLAGSATNTSTVLWSGGLGSYSPADTSLLMVYTPTAAEISAGSVTLILESTGAGGGCTNASDTVVVKFSDTLFVNPTYAPINCTGDNTIINAGGSGGTLPYTYAWSNGSTASSINVSAGTYSVTITDSVGCSATNSASVSEPTPIILSMSSTNTSTDLACDGTATVAISGGTGPYTVLWSNAETTLTASNLCYGVATVDVTDANGCTTTGSVVVNNPSCSAFSVTATSTDVSCHGDSTAQAFSFPSGGTAPYTFSWNTIPPQTTQDATGLGAGTYTVTVTDDLGCIDVASVTVLQPTIITNTMTHIDATSIGGNEGSATANPMGGTPGYTYTWIPTLQTTQTAVNLTANTYYVNILDANSCLKTDSVQVNEPPCNDFMLGVNPKNITCNGADNGSAYIIIAQGTAPYSISWSSGETDVTSVSGLAAGSYTVTVTDASNCTTFESFDITEPDALSIGIVPTNVSCNGASDGTIDLTVSGGVFPYTYNWTQGIVSVGENEDLVNLKPGTYSIEVTDANGCTITGSIGITEPDNLLADYVFSNILCNGNGDGAVDVTTTGGTLPYNFSWTGPSGFTSSSEDISALELGLYELQITDGNGCTLGTVLQSYINEPDTVLIQTYTVPCPTPGAGVTTVTIDSISGGAWGNYQVSFDNGSTYQPFGDYSEILAVDATYNTLAIDSNGCSTPLPTAIVIDPTVVISDVTFDPCVFAGTTDINVTVTPTGGDGGPYEVSTDGGSTYNAPGTYVISLPVGASYDIVIRDGKGCESVVWPITIASPFDATPALIAEASCPGATDGEIGLTVVGGTTPYTFAWTGPAAYSSSLEDISGLVAGWYYITVTDDSNCVINDSIEVTTTPDVTPPTITYCGGNQIVTSDGGVCTYTYSGTAWDATATDDCLVASIVYTLSGATTGTGTTLDNVAFNLGTTTVTWLVTDGSGNTASCSFTVEVQDDQLPAISTCGGVGTQNVVADGGVCTYTVSGTGWDAQATDNCTVSTIAYTLSGATSGTGTTLDGVAFNLGTTTVLWTVTDGSGNISTCTFDVDVTDDQLPVISTCGGSGTESVVADGGVCTYTVSGTGWDAQATDNCTVSTIAYTLSGATTGTGTTLDGVAFNLGTTTVLWTVTDGVGNISTCTFDVDVTDDQLPAITTCGGSGTESVVADFGVCTYTNTGIGWDAQATDNCTVSTIVYTLSGATTGAGTTLNGVDFNLGTTTVLWTVTDGSGNISTCTFDVDVIDDQLPVISSCGGIGTENVVVDLAACTYTVSGTGWDVTATDNCTIASSVYTLSGATAGTGTSLNGVAFNLGTTTVLWTVTDGVGNISTCTFDVNVTDDQLPAISTCGGVGTQNVVADGGVCTFTVSGTGWDAVATDNCTVSNVIYTLSGATTGSGTSLNGVAFNLGTTTVLWTVTDGEGNISTCTFDVDVADDQLPAITTCGGSGTEGVVADGGVCTYTVSGTGWDALATDNCTVSTIVYTLSGATSGTGTTLNNVVFNLGTTTVLWTVTDGSGNIETCTFDVEVTDDQLPAITTCGGSGTEGVVADFGVCTYTNTGTGWDAQATDNCTVSTIAYTLSGATTGTGTTLNGVVFNLGTTTVLWTVTDGSGNISTCTFDVEVTDSQDPVISSCGGIGIENVVVDLAACTYTVSGTGWDVTATDNCTIASSVYTLSGATTGTGTTLNGVAFNLGTTTVLWTVTDGVGNISTCIFDVDVTDGQLPAITSCGGVGTQNVVADGGVCTYTVSGTGWDATATDNCTVSTIVYTLSGATTGTGTSLNGVVFNLGTTTVLWTVTDGEGNISTCTFDVDVTDDQLPAITTCGGTGTENVVVDGGLCYYTVSGTGWDAQATDNCTVSTIAYTLSGATTGTGTTLNGVTFNLGTTTVLWTVTDGSGNISTCTFDVDVTDNQLPAITTCGPTGNQTVNADLAACTYAYSGTGWDAVATDNCTVSSVVYTLTGATTGTGTSLNGVAFNLGVTLVTWTVTDGSGNTTTCNFQVTVLDDQLPSILSCGAVGTQNMNTDPGVCTFTVSGTGWDATASDNCSIASINYVLNGATSGSGSTLDGVTFAQGTTTVTWTATDGSGNTTDCTFDVVVTDVEVPVISGCVTDIVVSNDVDDCGAIVTWTPPTFTDNCGATMTSTHVSGDFFPIGTTTVTYTVTDGSGNVSTCIFDVEVNDTELPQMNCPANIESCDSLVTFATPMANDNCGVVSVTQTAGLTSGSYFPVGVTTVTFEALDVNGNIYSCSFDVTIHPTPILNVVSNDVSCNGNGDGSINLTVTNGSVPYTYTWSNGASSEDLTGLQPGIYSVTVDDVFGCSASISDTITQPDQLLLSKEVENVTCYGDSNGTIDITVTGGVLPYSYDWGSGMTWEDQVGLPVGIYSVMVTDANGCQISNSTTITQPDSIDIQSVVTDATCNAANGSVSVLVTGGVSPYDYSWSNGATTNNLTNVVGGLYTLTITDDNGCVATQTDSVGSTSNISGYVYVTDVLCYGESTGSALAVIESGNTPFDYLWSTGDTTNMVEDLAAGSYSVYVQDAFGCEITLNFDILEPDSLIVELYSPEPLTGYNISFYGGSDGSIQSTVYGGVEDYSYQWSTGSIAESIYNLSQGTYSVYVTDANGCTATAQLALTAPRELAMPEGISPNGDGDNDYFVIKGINAYPNNDITIYNRWGNVVYQQSGYDNEWQGFNNKGEDLPDGTYFVVFRPTSDAAEPLTGYVDLRRGR